MSKTLICEHEALNCEHEALNCEHEALNCELKGYFMLTISSRQEARRHKIVSITGKL